MSKTDQILDAAVELSEKHGYEHVTREQIATKCGVATGSVSKHLGTMIDLRRAVVSAAIARKNLNIIAQALVRKHPKIKNIPQSLKEEAFATIIG